ncbi:hypothetical protein ACVS9P_07100 [Caproicibacterium sp. NSD3]
MKPFKVTMLGKFSVCWKDYWIVEEGMHMNKPFEVLTDNHAKR